MQLLWIISDIRLCFTAVNRRGLLGIYRGHGDFPQSRKTKCWPDSLTSNPCWTAHGKLHHCLVPGKEGEGRSYRGRASLNTEEKKKNPAIKILQCNHGRPFSLSFGKQSWDYSSAQWHFLQSTRGKPLQMTWYNIVRKQCQVQLASNLQNI